VAAKSARTLQAGSRRRRVVALPRSEGQSAARVPVQPDDGLQGIQAAVERVDHDGVLKQEWLLEPQERDAQLGRE